MSVSVRPFTGADAETVSELFASYMAEAYHQPNAMTAEILRRDEGRRFHLLLAVEATGVPVGFAAWRDAYDLHHAVSGGEIPDLFVVPASRGRVAAIRLVAAVGRAVLANGGKFIRAEVLSGVPSQLARRMTVGFASETVYLSGQGLRTVASLLDASDRELVKGLPNAEASRIP